MTLYQKVMSVWSVLRDRLARKADVYDLAPAFSAYSTYAPGAVVVYGGRLYRCTSAHQGEWNAAHFASTTVTALTPSVENLDGVVTSSDFSAFSGLELANTATQKETREMVQQILRRLQSLATCIAVSAASLAAAGAYGAVNARTKWEEVPPQDTVKSVVETFASDANAATASAISGTGNYASGTDAGKSGTGDRVTAAGQASAQSVSRVEDSVFIGHQAGKGAQRLKGVVAIGSGELSGLSRATNVVSINSMVYASQRENRLWLTPSPSRTGLSAPLYYDNGTLYLNAATVVTTGVSASDDYDYACYVSASHGDDANDGKSSSKAVRTLDRACQVATNGTVCVMAGTYDYPSYYGGFSMITHGVDFIAASGKDQTFITGTSAANPGIIHSFGYMSYFKGFTFSNVVHRYATGQTGSGPYRRGAVEYCAFSDCRFEFDCQMQQLWQYPLFFYCIIDACELGGRLLYAGSTEDEGDDSLHNNYGRLFTGCSLVNSVVQLDTDHASGVNFGAMNHVNNCFIRLSHAFGLGRFVGGNSAYGPVVGSNEIVDTTYIVSNYVDIASTYYNCQLKSGSHDIVLIVNNERSFDRNLYDLDYSYNAPADASYLSFLAADLRFRGKEEMFFLGYNSKDDRAFYRLIYDAMSIGFDGQ